MVRTAEMETVFARRAKSGYGYYFALNRDHLDVLGFCMQPRNNEEVVEALRVNQARLMEARDAGLVEECGTRPTRRGNTAKAFRTTDLGVQKIRQYTA